MARCAKLLNKATNSPKNLRVEDLCALAKCYGWVFQRQCGSHHIYMHPGTNLLMNFQPRNGNAKPTQVKQLLDAIEELDNG